MLWKLLLGGLPAGALPYQPGRHGPGPLRATPTTTCRRRNSRTGQSSLDKLSNTRENYNFDEPLIADTNNDFQIRDKFSANIVWDYQWKRKLHCGTRPVANAHLHASGQPCDVLTAASVIERVVPSETPVRILNGLDSWRGGGAISPGQPPSLDCAHTPGAWLRNFSRNPPTQSSDSNGGMNGCHPVANELVSQDMATDRLTSTRTAALGGPAHADSRRLSMWPSAAIGNPSIARGSDTERSRLIQPVAQECCPADASDDLTSAPHAGVLHQLGKSTGWARDGAGTDAGDGCGNRERHSAAQRLWFGQPSLGGPQQQAHLPSVANFTDSQHEEHQERRRPSRRHLGFEEFLHQYDALLEEQEAAIAVATKPRARRSRQRKRKTAGASDLAGMAAAHSVAESNGLAVPTLDAATKVAPGDFVCEKHRCDPVGEMAVHTADPQDMKPLDAESCAAGAQALSLLTDGINSGRANSTSPGRRPKLISLYTEFELAQGAALGRMPRGSGQSAWDQTRPPSAAAAGAPGPRSRSRRYNSSAGSQAELPPARNLEEPWTAEEKQDFWHCVCGANEGGAAEAGCGYGTVSNQRRGALLGLKGTPVLICVRQPEPYGAAEVYELPDLGLGPMDDATWEAWNRLAGSSRPLQPLMVVDEGVRLGFELCETRCRGTGGWRTYEVMVGPGYSHDSARTLHPLRLVCEGRVRFDARHVWDLVDFLADPTRAGIAAHLTSAALLRTGRDRESYHSPSFCHWLLLRRWGARGLAHVGWGPGDTLRHINAVRRWSQSLAREQVG
ncbi:hypothetical protein Vafri_2238 [Volvox africanus]|nr:hypothetical protein Vafri_2238 [Volvox africanus]